MGKLEDFLAGVPLTEENAALQRGEEPQESTPQANQSNEGASKRGPLSNDERDWLKRLTGEPGWAILMRLLENSIEDRQERAILLSQTDPIANQAEMAKQWTYVAAMKEAARTIRERIKEEIALLTLGENDGTVLGE